MGATRLPTIFVCKLVNSRQSYSTQHFTFLWISKIPFSKTAGEGPKIRFKDTSIPFGSTTLIQNFDPIQGPLSTAQGIHALKPCSTGAVRLSRIYQLTYENFRFLRGKGGGRVGIELSIKYFINQTGGLIDQKYNRKVVFLILI